MSNMFLHTGDKSEFMRGKRTLYCLEQSCFEGKLGSPAVTEPFLHLYYCQLIYIQMHHFQGLLQNIVVEADCAAE